MTRIAILFTALLLAPGMVLADVLDSDQANNEAYLDGWQAGDDGSTEVGYLGGWVLAGNAGEATIAIDSVISLGADKTDIDSNGKSFKLHDPDGGYVDVFRFIDPLGLEAGETLSLDLAVNFRGGYKGLDVRAADETILFTFNIGDDDYVVSKAAAGNGSIGDTYAADTRFHVAFTQEDENGGTWTITRGGAVSGTTSGSYAGRIRSLKLYSGNQDVNPEDALFFNNLQITSAD